MSTDATPPHIVHIVGNDVSGDSRVRKAAVTGARAGFRVTIVGMRTDAHPDDATIGSVDVRRVGVGSRFRAHAGRRGRHAATVRRIVAQHRVRGDDRLAILRELKRKQASIVGAAIVRHERRIAFVTRRHAPGWLVFGVRAASVAVMRTERMIRPLFLSGRRRCIAWYHQVARRVAQLRLRYHRPRSKTTDHERTVHQMAVRAQRRLLNPGAPPPRRLRWRRVLYTLFDLDAAISPVLDELAPDVIHAHDMHMIGIAVRTAARRRATGAKTTVLYDAHEYVRGYSHHFPYDVWRAHLDHEAEYINDVDAVLTVSGQLARRLQDDYGLAVQPLVVHNAPMPRRAADSGDIPSIREVLGLADDIPLLVHSGSASPTRGIDVAVDALAELPDVHMALVTNSSIADRYVEQARRLGAGSRLHLTRYVDADQVIAHLRDATAGLVLLRHCGNHEVALPNKLFEYLHAGIPVLGADVGMSAAFVRQHGLGETFAVDDPSSFADATRRLLDRHGQVATHIADLDEVRREFSWPSQEDVLVDTYMYLSGWSPTR